MLCGVVHSSHQPHVLRPNRAAGTVAQGVQSGKSDDDGDKEGNGNGGKGSGNGDKKGNGDGQRGQCQ
jgi:hypothetical protein